MPTQNEAIELSITDLTMDGRGIGRADGLAVFVPGALPDERVQARIVQTHPRYAQADLTDILEPSAYRQAPPCPYAERCGGCTLQHLQYDRQLQVKRRWIADALKRIGGQGIDVPPVMGMDDPFRYRNKAVWQISPEGACGLLERGSHAVVPVEDCLIQPEDCVTALSVLRSFLGRFTVRGALESMTVRVSPDRQALVHLRGRASAPDMDALLRALREALPGLRGLLLNGRVFWGEDEITQIILGGKFVFSCESFIQVNPLQTEALYRLAVEFAALTGRERVLDAYCGVGTIGLSLADSTAEVVGIERNAHAVRNARTNAQRLNTANARFIDGDVQMALPRLLREGMALDTAVLDPPRKGCDAAVLQALAQANIPRIVYVSCEPATLARDIARLSQAGYRLERVQGVDMFGFTGNIETVAVLVRI